MASLPNRLLNAVTALLVRNYEVITTVINGSYKQVLALQESNNSEQLEDPDSGTDELDQPDTADYPRNLYPAATSSSANLTAVANARHQDTSVFSTNYMLAEKGTSHRPHFGKWYELLNIPADDPLVNHAATLEDTFNIYRRKSVESERQSLMVEFSKYMVARCWQKMFRRISHWSSMASFRCLLRAVNFQASYDRCLHVGMFTASKRNDSMLGGLLTGQEEDSTNLVEDLIKRMSPFPQYYPDIPKLVKAYKENKASPERRMGWYTKDTCIEFHKLLISALIAYTNVLRIFKRVPRKRVAHADQLCQAAYLLWRISESRILRHHLRLLNFSQQLSYPVRSSFPDLARDLYELYGDITAEGLAKGDNNGDHGKTRETNQNDDSEDEGNDGESQREVEDDDQSEEHLGINLQGKFVLDQTYLRWIQLHAMFWRAQDIVTSSLGHHMAPENFEISVVQVKYPSKGDRKMIDWMTLIKELPLPNPQSVIDTIKEQIKYHVKSPQCHPIFREYNRQDFKPKRFTGHLHTELLMALLAHEGIQDHIRVQEIDPTFLSVSKLCCPVCWDALEILRGDSRDFLVRARHGVLSPVQLPPWTSDDLMEKMLQIYEERLVKQIKHMMLLHRHL